MTLLLDTKHTWFSDHQNLSNWWEFWLKQLGFVICWSISSMNKVKGTLAPERGWKYCKSPSTEKICLQSLPPEFVLRVCLWDLSQEFNSRVHPQISSPNSFPKIVSNVHLQDLSIKFVPKGQFLCTPKCSSRDQVLRPKCFLFTFMKIVFCPPLSSHNDAQCKVSYWCKKNCYSLQIN